MAFAMAFDGAIRGQTGQLTGFFTAPLLKSSTKTMATNPLVMISANSPLVTLSAPARPAYKTPIFWIMGAALAITLAAVLFLLLRPDDEAAPAATLSQARTAADGHGRTRSDRNSADRYPEYRRGAGRLRADLYRDAVDADPLHPTSQPPPR